jgi:hypothetical protein
MYRHAESNCMDTVNTLSVPIQYTFYPPLSSPLPFSSPSSPTHRYKVKIYINLKGTKYSSQVHKKLSVVPWTRRRKRGYSLKREDKSMHEKQYKAFLTVLWNILECMTMHTWTYSQTCCKAGGWSNYWHRTAPTGTSVSSGPLPGPLLCPHSAYAFYTVTKKWLMQLSAQYSAHRNFCILRSTPKAPAQSA